MECLYPGSNGCKSSLGCNACEIAANGRLFSEGSTDPIEESKADKTEASKKETNGLSKYRVYGIFTATKYLGEFEAPSRKAAEEAAASSEENYASLCHQCADEIDLDDRIAHQFVVEAVEE